MISNLLTRLRQPSSTLPMPAPLEYWRNDLAMLVVVALAFFLGLGLRTQALNATASLELGEGLPTVRYPANWRTTQPEGLHFQVIEPASASSFDTQIELVVRELKPSETLEQARVARALQRSRDLSHYRELSAAVATVLAAEPALVTTYAYVADPTRDSGGNGLPVVVQSQDLLFLQGPKLVIVTLAADATVWQAETQHFQLVTASLDLTPVEPAPPTVPGGAP